MSKPLEPRRLLATALVDDGVEIRIDFGWNIYTDLSRASDRRWMANQMMAALRCRSPLILTLTEETAKEIRRMVLALYRAGGAINASWYSVTIGLMKDLLAPYELEVEEPLRPSSWPPNTYIIAPPKGTDVPGFYPGESGYKLESEFELAKAKIFQGILGSLVSQHL
jgi:hypothetical protein